MKVIVYGDFNCLYYCLASQRADRLARDGTAAVEWRAVERQPRPPSPASSRPPARAGLTRWPRPRGSRYPASGCQRRFRP